MAAGSTYTPILNTSTTNNSTASVTLGSGGTISQAYTDLVLIINGSASTYSGAGNFNPQIRFNGDTGSNYSTTWMYGNGTTAGSARQTNGTFGYIGTMQTSGKQVQIVNINNYSNTTTYKSVITRNSDSVGEASAWVNLWRSTAAINSITILANGYFETGTTFTLYGIAKA